jgi:hypothetical protein
MQEKLVADAKRFKKLPLAAKLAGVTLKDTYKAGTEIHVEVSGKSINNFIALGKYEATITDEEVAAFEKQQEAKKKA